MDLFVVLGGGLLWQFAAHDIMGQVGQQFEIGHFLENVEGEQQVIGEAITVGFQQNGKVHLLGQTLPAFDQLDSLLLTCAAARLLAA